MPEQRTVASVRKNARQEIRIGLQEYEGRQIASLRVWFKAEDGTMRPGNDGLNFRVDPLPELHEALAEAVRAAEAEGLLDAAEPRRPAA
ncbi:PC4/YdbC family ssDNA-binding protein [Methylobacterium sp. J-043]|nr:PC4/YdbC family ssDNA-binding protein [Methylobacterium sp. J-043]